ncbi:unnamed protein product [Linum trigynum]|uniref:Uncharacterized protein n=1 Tax=Linum trigynum TaxID=586398 RepID=A0AAV2DCD3_9ROSI
MRESSTPQEHMDFIANAWSLDPYSNTYNEGWRQHSNFSWNGNTTNHLVSQHQQVVFSRGSISRLDRGQSLSSSLTSRGRGNHFSSPSVSMPS